MREHILMRGTYLANKIESAVSKNLREHGFNLERAEVWEDEYSEEMSNMLLTIDGEHDCDILEKIIRRTPGDAARYFEDVEAIDSDKDHTEIVISYYDPNQESMLEWLRS